MPSRTSQTPVPITGSGGITAVVAVVVVVAVGLIFSPVIAKRESPGEVASK